MTLTNANQQILSMAAENDGVLPTFAWPGGYPIVYLDKANNTLCPACANKNDEFSEPLTAFYLNYEDNDCFCDHCGDQIESAYADDSDDADLESQDDYDQLQDVYDQFYDDPYMNNDSYGDCTTD